MVIDMDINLIKGVGSKSIELLSKMDLLTINDLINYYPYRYNVIKVVSLDDAMDGETCTIKGIVDTEPRVSYISKAFNRMWHSLDGSRNFCYCYLLAEDSMSY